MEYSRVMFQQDIRRLISVEWTDLRRVMNGEANGTIRDSLLSQATIKFTVKLQDGTILRHGAPQNNENGYTLKRKGSIGNGAAFFVASDRPAQTGLLLRDDAQKPAQNPENGHRSAEIASFLRDDAAATRAEHRGKFRQKTMEKHKKKKKSSSEYLKSY